MTKKVLGRGLGALIPESEPSPSGGADIDVDLISRNPDQPRFKFDEQKLEELTASVRSNGILQPILVRPLGAGFQLVAGERRLMAAQRAGLLKVPAVVREVPEDKMLELALIENIQREELNPIEEAQAYQRLLDSMGKTQEDLAAHLGKDRSTVSNSIRLLKLPPAVKLLVAEGKLSPGHARALLASSAGPSEMAKTAAKIVEQGWSVRDAERWSKRHPRGPRASRPEDPNVAAAANRLRLMLGTKVEIHGGSGPKATGQIRIHYYSQDDLMRIYSILTERRSH